MITAKDLEARWQSISHLGIRNYRSLLLSSDSIPDLYIGKDITGSRYLILQVPSDFTISDGTTKLEHLSLTVQSAERLVIIGLRTLRFSDLFNDLILSLYHKVKGMSRPEDYTLAFTDSFSKWTEFFEGATSGLLSKHEVQGLFGELLMLRYLLSETSMPADNFLLAWQGPYGRAQDFTFPGYNLEVKTIDVDQAIIHISSEHQLQPEGVKALQLAIVTVQEHSAGLTIEALYGEIRGLISSLGGDVSIFLKALLHAGISIGNISSYTEWRWQPIQLALYDCCSKNDFPKIIVSQIQEGISGVKYQLAINSLTPFIIKTISL